MTSSRALRFLSWSPALLAMAAIFWLSSLPGDAIRLPGFRFSDKAVHFAAYAVLGILIGIRGGLFRALERRRLSAGPGSPPATPPGTAGPPPAGMPTATALGSGVTPPSGDPGRPPYDRLGAVIGILYAFSDELHQAFVPLREPSLGDFAADALGIAAGIWLARRLAGAATYRRFRGSRLASQSGRRLSKV